MTEIMNVREAAERYKVSRECVYLWTKKNPPIPYMTKQKGLINILIFEVQAADKWVRENTRSWGK